MCGIAGYATRSVNLVGKVTLEAMASAIAHRGPDDSGYFETRTTDGICKIGMAHRRLSIIDLGGGHQPMHSQDNKAHIVFNGEIYNYLALRDELTRLGHNFETKSDTETILHAYQEWGVSCVSKLSGMFSFAIWDELQEHMFLARDRFGKKPLFFRYSEDTLIFASEAKAIFAFPGISRMPNSDALQQYLLYRYVPSPNTVYVDIYKIMPGTYAIWKGDKLVHNTYYLPPDRVKRASRPIIQKPVKNFLETLDRAVKIRMNADVPFGAFLSGGLDSSMIVGLMARHSELPIKTFSIGFKESSYSELPFASQIAEQFHTEHNELMVSARDLMDHLPTAIQFRGAPISEPSDIALYLLSLEAAKSVKMVLTGEGADELLAGYPKHVFERFAKYYLCVPKVLRKCLFEQLVQSLPYDAQRVKTAVFAIGLREDNERLPRWFGALSNVEISKLLIATKIPDGRNVEPRQFNTPTNNSALRKILYFDQTSWLPDNLLERGDSMTMAASLEARMPFMDHELVDFISDLPDRWRVRRGTGKFILREAAKELLPKSILNRPKVGLRLPIGKWFRHEMRGYLFDHLMGPESRTSFYYKTSELSRILAEHNSRVQNHEKLLWSLLTFEIWYRQNV